MCAHWGAHGPNPPPHLMCVEDFHPPVDQSPGAWTKVAIGAIEKWRGSGQSTSGLVLYTSGSGSWCGFGRPASTRAPGRPNAGIAAADLRWPLTNVQMGSNKVQK